MNGLNGIQTFEKNIRALTAVEIKTVCGHGGEKMESCTLRGHIIMVLRTAHGDGGGMEIHFSQLTCMANTDQVRTILWSYLMDLFIMISSTPPVQFRWNIQKTC